jgi:hypothetical protein
MEINVPNIYPANPEFLFKKYGKNTAQLQSNVLFKLIIRLFLQLPVLVQVPSKMPPLGENVTFG